MYDHTLLQSVSDSCWHGHALGVASIIFAWRFWTIRETNRAINIQVVFLAMLCMALAFVSCTHLLQPISDAMLASKPLPQNRADSLTFCC